MNFPIHSIPKSFATACTFGALCTFVSLIQAQSSYQDENAWIESAVTPPEAFSIEVLQTVDVATNSALSYGIDPDSLRVGDDGVVRYVMVARSSSGALNVLYQGIRCATGQAKTYARLSDKRVWNISAEATWQALSFSGPTRPAMMLARQGVCDGRTVTGDPRKILSTLKSDRNQFR